MLYELSSALIHADSTNTLFEKIMDAAVSLQHAVTRAAKKLHPQQGEGGKLQLLSYRGFSHRTAKFWELMSPTSECMYGVALRTR
jgi:hypothetical protein